MGYEDITPRAENLGPPGPNGPPLWFVIPWSIICIGIAIYIVLG